MKGKQVLTISKGRHVELLLASQVPQGFRTFLQQPHVPSECQEVWSLAALTVLSTWTIEERVSIKTNVNARTRKIA